MATAQATTDHDEIRKWVEARGGRPARVKATGRRKDPGILRIDFPGFSGEDTLEEIEWEEFFEWFDRNNLAALLSQARGNRFNKLIDRGTAATSSKKKSTTKKKTAAKKESSLSSLLSSVKRSVSGGGSAKKSSAKKASSKKSSSKKASSTKSTASSKKASSSKKAATSRKATAPSRKASPTKKAAPSSKKASSKKATTSSKKATTSSKKATTSSKKATPSRKASSSKKSAASSKKSTAKQSTKRASTSNQQPATSNKQRATSSQRGSRGGSSKTTTDRDEIRKWVEARGGFPAHVTRTAGPGDDPGVLRIDYPGFSGRDTLERISWDEWFEAFDRNKLAFLYQDKKNSRFSKLVAR